MMDELTNIAREDQARARLQERVNEASQRGCRDAAQASSFYRQLVGTQVPIQIAATLTNTYVVTVIRDSAGQEGE